MFELLDYLIKLAAKPKTYLSGFWICLWIPKPAMLPASLQQQSTAMQPGLVPSAPGSYWSRTLYWHCPARSFTSLHSLCGTFSTKMGGKRNIAPVCLQYASSFNHYWPLSCPALAATGLAESVGSGSPPWALAGEKPPVQQQARARSAVLPCGSSWVISTLGRASRLLAGTDWGAVGNPKCPCG